MSSSKKSLKDFGYAFKDGKLRQLDEAGEVTDKPFKFEVSPTSTRAENQENYEALGDVLNEYVYELLEENGMHRIYIPSNIPKEKATFIFSSREELKDIDKLMVIIHGSGVVRAGQWARSLIINDSINSGTILPYIKKAQDAGYEVIVTNTNDNERNGKRIEGNSSPEMHADSVWQTFVQSSNAKSIAVVAHSYGGVVVAHLASKFKEDFDEKVFAIAFTDSVHGRGLSKRVNEIGVNFVTSDKPVNTILKSYDGNMQLRSAGHHKHEMTSWSCIDSLFEFLNQRYEEERGSTKIKKQKLNEEL